MTLSDIGEIIKVLGAVATGTAAWFAAITAYKGLGKWRSETFGKRKADLAANVLTTVYEMAEILRAARDPWVSPHETAKLAGTPDHIAENANFAPERRLLEHQEFFGRFRALRHEFLAVFGKDAAVPFDQLWRIRIDVNHAVESMLRNAEMGKSRDPEDQKLWREWYRTAFRNPVEANDEITKRITLQVETTEGICRPAIEARSA